ncbi:MULTISPECIES: hypothetical protein [unclassified Rhodococcus (in: high G+C Gram-positive bacteria)]|uniref:hypothetical protein n=1 Tax=unclassified Rhodococcus (in: high G+C Gram-positive bacteria) TaxID=192944 RepID=UPI00117A1EB5|nr:MULTISPECIES: hypothetical protein [unclassified Rhodococcus (in: high G+C Gram-positive bacteria)]
MTIRDAATRLGVSRQRINQMLKARDLYGPPQPSGTRAPRNAPRVFVSSLESWEAGHAGRRGGSHTVSEATLRDDAYRMKLALDVARDQLTMERRQNEKLTGLLADAVAALQAEHEMARKAERITEEYAAIATNHLGPDIHEVP